MAEAPPSPDLLAALGRLVRGLSALFWGLPVALVVCVQTAKGDWLRPLGVLPPLAVTGLLVYALTLLRDFQKQERVWAAALERARVCALVNLGFSPFLYFWNRLPDHPFFIAVVELMVFAGLVFLLLLNPVLWRLAAMLPDETLRLETKLFTNVNRWLLVVSLAALAGYFVLAWSNPLPHQLIDVLTVLDRSSLWILLFLILLPVAMTMALIWKIKEVIYGSVFSSGRRF
jgi:hypothetical protein